MVYFLFFIHKKHIVANSYYIIHVRILPQMLYGKRPYGENVTQDRIWKDNLIGNAGDVAFHASPKVRSWMLILVDFIWV